ncbi:MAG: diguanylate cyclase [Pirellulaceae bacterium]
MVVDDDRLTLALLEDVLTSEGFQVTAVASCLEALQVLDDSTPRFNFLITDWELRDGRGVELIQYIRESYIGGYVYTLVITAHENRGYNTKALDAGADDFIPKPIDRDELVSRLRSGERILKLESRLTNLANFDSVTQLPTRRMFEALAAKEWSRTRRCRLPLSCVVFDLDFFKRVNDTYGHRAGDQVLRKIAELFRDSSRQSDLLCRQGGEEFCILLPETTLEQASSWAERLRAKFAAEIFELDSVVLNVTASFGVAEILADMEELPELIEVADQCLLQAKSSGRNRTISCHHLQNESTKAGSGGIGDVFEGATARDGMTAVISRLKPESTVVDVSYFFLQFRISSAPVIDEEGRLIGIVSEKDLMSAAKQQNPQLIRIRDIMRNNVVTYDAETPLQVIWEFLARVSIRGVVIVDHGSPVGYIGRQSILRWLANSVWARSEVNTDVAHGRLERIQTIAHVSQMLEEEAGHIGQVIQDLPPFEQQALVVGTVSRMQELINDLLSSSGGLTLSCHQGRERTKSECGETQQRLHGLLGNMLTSGPH